MQDEILQDSMLSSLASLVYVVGIQEHSIPWLGAYLAKARHDIYVSMYLCTYVSTSTTISISKVVYIYIYIYVLKLNPLTANLDYIWYET